MAFDYQAAKDAGYSDAEIAEFLAADNGMDLEGARAAGYADAEIIKHFTQPQEAPALEYDPTEGMNAAEKLGAAVVRGADYGIGLLKGALNEGATAFASTPVGRQLDSLGVDMGLDPAQQVENSNRAAREENKRIAAALLGTTPGKVGNFLGTVGVVAPTALIPGANTYAGATLVGAGTGAALSEGDGLNDRAKDAVIGAVGGAGGKAIGTAIGAGAKALKDRVLKEIAERAPQMAQRQEAVLAAQGAGYVLPPATANPSFLNNRLEGLSGKLLTGQEASLKNQMVTNNMVRKALGLGDDTPLTTEALQAIRQQAGASYDAIKSYGPLFADKQYFSALDDLAAKYEGAAKDFPGLAKDDIRHLVQALKKDEFGADSAIDAIKVLRETADGAYAKGDAALGKTAKGAAGAMEGLVERNLEKTGQGALLADFKNARQVIAKTHTVNKALNSETGNVNAQKLAAELLKGKPLSGEIKQVAQFARAFPEAAKEAKGSVPGLSPLDYYGAGGISAATGNPELMSMLLIRPAVRKMLLSKPYQRAFATPQEERAALARALSAGANSRIAQGAAPAVGAVGARSLFE